MTQINIPSITIDTPIPFDLNLREKGQPLDGLRTRRHHWARLTWIHIGEEYARWHGGVGEVIAYKVTTVGLAPQTRREKRFGLSERAAMVTYVNEWIAKTVAAGLKKMAEDQANINEAERIRYARIAEEIEKAGGVEARRQQIVREGHGHAANDAFKYQYGSTYAAIIDALIHNTPIRLDEEIRTKILARYEEGIKTSWSVKTHIESQTRELDEFLGKTQQEEAA